MYALIFSPELRSWSIIRKSDKVQHQNSYHRRIQALEALDKINAGLIQFQPWKPAFLNHQTD